MANFIRLFSANSKNIKLEIKIGKLDIRINVYRWKSEELMAHKSDPQ